MGTASLFSQLAGTQANFVPVAFRKKLLRRNILAYRQLCIKNLYSGISSADFGVLAFRTPCLNPQQNCVPEWNCGVGSFRRDCDRVLAEMA
jgi:hypothetical protein